MRSLAWLWLATLLALSSLLSAQTFTGPNLLPPLDATNIVVADVNHDGYADLIYTQANANTVAVALSRGDGTFEVPSTYFAGEGALAIAIGDFNGDKKLDLAIATPGSSLTLTQVSVLLGNGDGSFQSPVIYQVGGVPNSIAVADLNNDGRPDIAALSSDRKLTILTNTGSSFSAQTLNVQTYYDNNGGMDPTYSVTAGDFNGDHRIDLAYVDSCYSCDVSQETYWIMTNKTSGWSFATGPTGTGTYVLRAFDLDLDGKSDLVSTYAGCHTPCAGTKVDYSNGNGTFTRVYAFGSGFDNPVTYDATMGDFNNDGKMDLAAIVSSGYWGQNYTYQTPGIAVLTGKGGRSGFNSPVFFLYPSSDTNSAEGAFIDGGFFEANGRKDLGTPTFPSENQVAYWLNTTVSSDDPCPYPPHAGVHLCSPISVLQVGSGEVKFVASARAGTQPLNRIELWIDGKEMFQVFADRLEKLIRLPSGTHIADVIERDAVGASAKAQVTFFVP